MHLADCAIHRLLQLSKREAKEPVSAHDLCLLLDLVLSIVIERGLPLDNADEHVLLGLIQRENGGAFTTCDPLDDLLRRRSIQAEASTKNVLRVEGRQHGDMTTNTDTSNEQLVSAAAHLLNLTLNDLLHVGEALRLKQVLSLGVPSAAPSLIVLFKDYGSLNTHHIDELVESEQFIRSFDKEGVDVLLWVLSMIVKEDKSGLAWVDKAAIWSSNWLEDDVIANVMLEETILCGWLSRFFSAHFSLLGLLL